MGIFVSIMQFIEGSQCLWPNLLMPQKRSYGKSKFREVERPVDRRKIYPRQVKLAEPAKECERFFKGIESVKCFFEKC